MAKNTSNQTTEETSDENPTPNTVAILKHSFNVSYPYAPGHPLTELEADALNVLRGQRIAGRVRDTVKELLDAEGNLSAENVAKIQADVDVIDADFTFPFSALPPQSIQSRRKLWPSPKNMSRTN